MAREMLVIFIFIVAPSKCASKVLGFLKYKCSCCEE